MYLFLQNASVYRYANKVILDAFHKYRSKPPLLDEHGFPPTGLAVARVSLHYMVSEVG